MEGADLAIGVEGHGRGRGRGRGRGKIYCRDDPPFAPVGHNTERADLRGRIAIGRKLSADHIGG